MEESEMKQIIGKFEVQSGPGIKSFKSGRLMKVIRWDTQRGKPYFWAVVDLDDPREYMVHTYYTGEQPIIGDFDRIGTTLHEGGEIVLHHVLKEMN
jgi:hypothetical protein